MAAANVSFSMLSCFMAGLSGTLVAACMLFAYQKRVVQRAPLPAKDDSTDDESDNDDELSDGQSSEGHKMVLVVRTDLKMTKGKIAAQCGHAVLGAYKSACKRTPQYVRNWENWGQAKVAVKVDSEEEQAAIIQAARERGLNHYLVVDAGRTQIASGSKTVVGIGPAPESLFIGVTDKLKLL